MKPISDARTCKDGCTYLQGRLHVRAGKVASTSMENAVHCKDGCSALQRRLQCTAGTVAVHCGNGCSALRLRWVKQKDISCGVLPSRQRFGDRALIRGRCPRLLRVVPSRHRSACRVQSVVGYYPEDRCLSLFIALR